MDEKPVLILSPHCDDAALAMGGTIQTLCCRSVNVHILTCFSYSAYSIYSNLSNTTAVSELRQSEDREMAYRVDGLTPKLQYLHLPDAPLRRGRNQGNLYDNQMLQQEEKLVNIIVDKINRLSDSGSVFFVPIGIGGHVDHIICRKASERSKLTTDERIYYEDQPYTAISGIEVWRDAIRGMSSFKVNFRVYKKEHLIDCYNSQIYPSDRQSILNYSRSLSENKHSAAERFWKYDY